MSYSSVLSIFWKIPISCGDIWFHFLSKVSCPEMLVVAFFQWKYTRLKVEPYGTVAAIGLRVQNGIGSDPSYGSSRFSWGMHTLRVDGLAELLICKPSTIKSTWNSPNSRLAFEQWSYRKIYFQKKCKLLTLNGGRSERVDQYWPLRIWYVIIFGKTCNVHGHVSIFIFCKNIECAKLKKKKRNTFFQFHCNNF